MRQEGPLGAREMFARALQHHQAGRLKEAEQLYREILQNDPRHADSLQFLGVIAHQVGRNESAVELIGKAIALNDRVPPYHNNLGNALKALGKLDAAAAAYRRALSQKPDYVQAHFNLGITLEARGELAEAAASYERAVTYQPNHAEAYLNLGNVLQARGKLAEAVASYGRALSCRPGFAEAHGNLANVLWAQGAAAEAVAAYGRALSCKPDYAEAHSNLGNVLLEQGKLEEAVLSYGRALHFKPDYTEAHSNLGNALKEQGRLEEAAASYRRALALEADYGQARLGLALAVIPLIAATVAESSEVIGKFSRSLDELLAWSSANPGKLGKAVGHNQPFYLAYRPGDVTALLSRYGDLACIAAAAYWQPKSEDRRVTQSSPGRIRVVVVSGQVRQHPVWDVLLRGMIANIDRRRFEIFLYHTGSLVDAETEWAQSRVDRFVQGPRPLHVWLEEVARDRPDVMFYPEVGMDPATCALAALRLAPVQVAGWGHPVTTGLPSMDLFVSGELLEGTVAEAHYRERLVRLPGTGVCTELVASPPQRWEAPALATSAPGTPARETSAPGTKVVRFALCHQPIKFDPAHDLLFARIAKAVGPSEFWLASPAKLDWVTARVRARLAAAFRGEGLDPDVYLRVMPWLTRDQFAGFLDAMDVYLDCPAFSGYTTAWRAIHRGLPIVTLEGDFLRQRLAAGLLRQIGMTEGIAASGDQYVEIAVRWAAESRRSEEWGARREAMRRAAPRADGNQAAVRAFEQALIDGVTKSPRV
jgi:protein O-GlcNAc transferase